jgi:hypothetical protein
MRTKILVGMAIIMALGFITAIICAGETKNEELGWINVKITNTDTGKDILSIRVPLSLLDLANEFDHESKVGISSECKIDFKKLIELLKKNNNQFLIKIEDTEEHKAIKIWID